MQQRVDNSRVKRRESERARARESAGEKETDLFFVGFVFGRRIIAAVTITVASITIAAAAAAAVTAVFPAAAAAAIRAGDGNLWRGSFHLFHEAKHNQNPEDELVQASRTKK